MWKAVGPWCQEADSTVMWSFSDNCSLVVSHRACASSETESEAGDIMEQQLEEMNKQLNSVTDPTGFLRMVRHNNLLHRYGTCPYT